MDISNEINKKDLSMDEKKNSLSSPLNEKMTNKRNIVKFRKNQRKLSQDEKNNSDKIIEKFQENSLNNEENSMSPFYKRKHQIPIKYSVGENKLNEIIHDLNENPIEEESLEENAFNEEKPQITNHIKWIKKSRQFIVHLMEQAIFHYAIIVLIIVDLLIVFIELVIAQLSLPCLTDDEMEQYNVTVQRQECLLLPTPQVESGELTLYYISLILISIFVIEILSAFYAFGWRRYTKLLYLIDAIIVLASFVMEVYFHFGNIGKAGKAAAGLVILRLWKIIRAIHAIAHSMALKNHMVLTEIEKAQKILRQEKLQAEQIISQQNIQIKYLQDTLDNQKNIVCRNRTNSLNSITLF